MLRGGVMLCATAAAAYAMLPVWVPTGWLARRLERGLCALTDCPVSIGQLRLSWSEGIALHNVRVGDRPDSGRGDMVVIGDLRCELAPWKMLFGGDGSDDALSWVRLNDVRVNVAVDKDGNANLAALRGLNLSGPPPRRVAVKHVTVLVQLPDEEKRLRLEVSDLQYRSGRLAGVGQVTMSAELAQQGEQAPVTLVASVDKKDPVARCSFHFSRLDLSQLALTRLPGFPLKELGGISSGRLDCSVGADGVVEDFRFSVKVRGLDAKPRSGPALPVIEQAEVTLEGSYDWYPRKVVVDTFRLKLPGVDLKGKGRVHQAVLAGGWEGVESMETTGRIDPQRLAALLRGRLAPLPGNVRINGDVWMRLSIRRNETQIDSSVLLDATTAEIWVGDRLAKPAGRPLLADVHGSMERRTWRFTVDQTQLQLGGNHFRGSGALQNIRRLIGQYVRGERPVTPATVLADMAGLNWRGSCEIADLPALRDLLGPSALRGTDLRGTVSAQWSMEHQESTLLRCMVSADPETHLVVAERFVKPAGKSMRVDWSSDLSADPPRLGRGRLTAWVGGAVLSVDDASVTVSRAREGPAEAPRVRVEGRYWLRNARELLGCFPALSRRAKGLDGAARGNFRVDLAPALTRVFAYTDATQLAMLLGDNFDKPAGQPAQVTVDFRVDRTVQAARNRVEVWANGGGARVAGVLSYGPAPAAQPIRLKGQARITDAAWLLQWSPRLRRALAGWGVAGGMTADFDIRSDANGLSGQISADADDLEFRLPTSGGAKARGAALRVRLAGRVSKDRAVIDRAAVDMGKSSLAICGTIVPASAARQRPVGRHWPPPGLAAMDLTARGWISADPTFRALLPRAARRIASARPGGYVRVALRLHGDGQAANLDGQFDATPLSLAVTDLVRKPAGTPATGSFSLTVPPSLASVRVKQLAVDIAGGRLRASGCAPLLGNTPAAARVTLDVPDLGQLAACCPRLAAYRPSGAAKVVVDYQRRGGAGVIRTASVTARRARANVRGKCCQVDGTIHLTGVHHRAGKVWVDRVATDPLRVAVGDNRFFTIACLDHLPHKPTGKVTVLCDRIDLAELLLWASGEKDLVKTAPLSPAERRLIEHRGQQAVAAMRKALAAGDVFLRFRADRVRHFDPIVRAFYEVQDVEVHAHSREGKILAGYSCGLNGGRMEYEFETNLADPHPCVLSRARLDRLVSSENILLQLAQEFPGNTVYGDFSRTVDARYSLRDVCMNMLDSRCLLVPVGAAVTVTENGVVRGQGAPKFITRAFPGLNLATYKYDRMTAFADFYPDGATANDMIFDGKTYNLYIEGVTDANRIGRYEIGVLLLVDPEKPVALHLHRQGRIPLLKFKARIENGRFYNEEVHLVRPDEAAYKIFLKNNIVYRLWKAGKKRPSDIPISTQTTSGK